MYSDFTASRTGTEPSIRGPITAADTPRHAARRDGSRIKRPATNFVPHEDNTLGSVNWEDVIHRKLSTVSVALRLLLFSHASVRVRGDRLSANGDCFPAQDLRVERFIDVSVIGN
jgi:hypothetical protein